ncbi:MAG: RNA polymerase sigma-70 factor [Solitalea sp.]
METGYVEFDGTALIELLQARDEQAFEQLFKAFYKPLHAYAFVMLKDETEAEEMVQRVFVTLWNKCERLTIESSLKAYLYRAVRNECLNYLKHQKVRAAYRVYYRARPEGGEERADDRLVAGELRVRLREAMDQLPPQCRTIFQLSRFEQLKYREIADELGISVKTVENQMGKALRLMRVKLSEFLPLFVLLLNLMR